MKCKMCNEFYSTNICFSNIFKKESQICDKCKSTLKYNNDIQSFPLKDKMGHYLSVFTNKDKFDFELDMVFSKDFGELLMLIISNSNNLVLIIDKNDILYNELKIFEYLTVLNQSDIYFISTFYVDLTKYFLYDN